MNCSFIRAMNRAPMLLLTFVALQAGALALAAQIKGERTGSVIDASDFPTLQLALNAIPTNGGTVRIPPGNFEIHEPLVIRTGEIRIEGAGAATRIINHNTNGKPAIVINLRNIAAKKISRIWR